MSTIKYYNRIDKETQDSLTSMGFVETDGDDPAVVVVRSAFLYSLDEEKKKIPVKEMARVQIVGRAGVGTGNVPVDHLQDKLVPVVYAPGGNACSVAEHTLGKLVDAGKNTMASIEYVKAHPETTPPKFEEVKGQFAGKEIHGKSIAIFGLGNIASRFAAMCASLHMRVYVIVRSPQGQTLEEKIFARLESNSGCASKYMNETLAFGGREVQAFEKLGDNVASPGHIYITPDVVSVIPLVDVHSPHIGDQKSGPVFNVDYLSKCKKGSILLNTDRGSLVDEEAVLKALQDGKLSQYHTDFAPKLLSLRSHKGCFPSPHTAASTGDAMKRCATMVAEALGHFLFDGNVINSKNFPTVFLDRAGSTRVSIVSKEDVHEIAKSALGSFTILQEKKGNNGKVFISLFDLKEEVKSIPQLQVIKGKTRVLGTNSKFEEFKKSLSAQDSSVYNFFAGPATLPCYVLSGLRCWLKEWHKTGISFACYSHRSAYMTNMVKEMTADIRNILKIPENYQILYIQGGATMQFSMIPLNLSKTGDRIGFVKMGTWSNKAVADAKKCVKLGCGNPDWIVDGSALEWKEIPKVGPVPQDLAYLHLAWNETIHGIEWDVLPDSGKVPLVLDASSNIFSRPIPWTTKNIGLVFAGAQKNSGIAGSAIVIVREDLMKIGASKDLPTYLNYTEFAKADSMHNTPSTVTLASIYFNCKWILKMGGVEGLEKMNKFKAGLIYDCLEKSNGYYIPRAVVKHRSMMNIVFNLKGGKDLEKKFVTEAVNNGLVGLGGHRSIGGARASVYNGMPVKGCKKLADYCVDFMKRNPL